MGRNLTSVSKNPGSCQDVNDPRVKDKKRRGFAMEASSASTRRRQTLANQERV